MAEFPPPPNIAPQDDGSGVAQEPVRDASEPAPITDQEVGEYREQDRFLPVRLLFSFLLSLFLSLSLLCRSMHAFRPIISHKDPSHTSDSHMRIYICASEPRAHMTI